MTKNSEVQTNGNGVFKPFRDIKKVTEVPNIWTRLEFNEWTFSLLLFTFSLIIVVVKLAVNLENAGHWSLMDRRVIPKSNQLQESNTVIFETYTKNISRFLENYGWFIRAAASGLMSMGFSWFIIYKDSNIPGINPPSPFRNSKERFTKEIGLSTNYLVGALYGMLIFIYMCL